MAIGSPRSRPGRSAPIQGCCVLPPAGRPSVWATASPFSGHGKGTAIWSLSGRRRPAHRAASSLPLPALHLQAGAQRRAKPSQLDTSLALQPPPTAMSLRGAGLLGARSRFQQQFSRGWCAQSWRPKRERWSGPSPQRVDRSRFLPLVRARQPGASRKKLGRWAMRFCHRQDAPLVALGGGISS